jgi:flavin reductase (DIM6/NTAB) family NADH-FMN oxidoreductase RutF
MLEFSSIYKGAFMAKKSIPPATILHPHPVLLIGTYGADGKPNIMNAAWGGICCSEPPCVAVSLREATLTYHNILHSQAFTVGIPSQRQVEIADYAGIYSGHNHDKFKETGLTPVQSEKVKAPITLEFPYTLECNLMQHHKLGLHTIFIGEIVGIQADEEILGGKGLPDIEKVEAILYGGFGSNNYYAVGKPLGKAFSIGKRINPSA